MAEYSWAVCWCNQHVFAPHNLHTWAKHPGDQRPRLCSESGSKAVLWLCSPNHQKKLLKLYSYKFYNNSSLGRFQNFCKQHLVSSESCQDLGRTKCDCCPVLQEIQPSRQNLFISGCSMCFFHLKLFGQWYLLFNKLSAMHWRLAVRLVFHPQAEPARIVNETSELVSPAPLYDLGSVQGFPMML